ncbi:MAG: 50S ribosomal protein L22 [Alphaproteobacteria bacterium]|nr:50S ribosomal protein L22 [Alphaproteobacteria bacterium]
MMEKQSRAMLKSVKGSPQKVNLVADLIRCLDVKKALNILSFVQKRVAKPMHDLLRSAISNAENNHDMDVDALYVKEVLVGKSLVLKRSMPCAKGRGARITKPFSKITIILEEKEGTDGSKG